MTNVTLVAIILHINFIFRIPASKASLQKQLRIKLISRLDTLITAGQCGKAILPKLSKSFCLDETVAVKVSMSVLILAL